MHIFDICALAFALVFVVIGIKRGFVIELFRLFAVVGGFFGAYLFYSLVFARIDFIKVSHEIRTIIAFVITFCAVFFVFIAVGWVIKKIIHFSMLGWLDRMWGGIFGLVKACLIIWALSLIIAVGLPHDLRAGLSTSIAYATFTKLPIRLDIPRWKSKLPGGMKGLSTTAMDSIKKTIRSINTSLDSTGKSGKPHHE
jgi:membrane protein required for colicin V production